VNYAETFAGFGWGCVCLPFSDDGTIIDLAGMLPEDTAQRLAQFAQWYRRMVSGNTIYFPFFTDGWLDAIKGMGSARFDNDCMRDGKPCVYARKQ